MLTGDEGLKVAGAGCRGQVAGSRLQGAGSKGQEARGRKQGLGCSLLASELEPCNLKPEAFHFSFQVYNKIVVKPNC